MEVEYEATIGLEVHAQLLTASKLFCGCPAAFGAPPNSNACPVCAGLPGVLPVVNREAVDFALRTALATNCQIARRSRWARKNYFYPDLPKGYQISQYELPLAAAGYVEIDIDGERRRIGVTRIHMEEDAGKNLHHPDARGSLVDLNRAGVPLLEIVSEPEIRSAGEATAYLRSLHAILRYLEVCDGNMEEGSFRCDANVSVRPTGASGLGVKTEVKNMNSFRAVEKALDYEIKRQTEVLREGGTVVQETRLWDADREETRAMRTKEYAHDYRYFPEPDLPPLVVDEGWIETVRAQLPELPAARRARFVRDYGIPAYDAEVLTARKDVADYYEEALRTHHNPKALSNWVMGDLLRVVHDRKLDAALTIREWPVPPTHLAGLVRLIDDGTISGKIAKTLFTDMLTSGEPPERIVAEKGLKQMTDEGAIATVVDQVLAESAEQVAAYRAGKQQVLGYLVGQVMKATQGKANPRKVNELLKERLSK